MIMLSDSAIQYAFMICSEKAHYKSGIYCSDLDTKNLVENHIKSLCESYSDDVLRTVFRRSDTYVMFKNGSILKVLSASDNSRGQRFNLVIFDKEINKIILDHVIRPFDMGDRLEYCLYHDKKETGEEK